jgi:pyrroloquinoline quinone (PQQ) biosynthesis protein C
MNSAAFQAAIGKLADQFRLDKHPYFQLVYQGKATRDQLRHYPIQHYEMTVRDADLFGAEAFLRLRKIDPEAARSRAASFAEEALGIYSGSASHLELLFELWEGGLGFPRKELIESQPTADARLLNGLLHRLRKVKPRFVGAGGLLEEMEVEGYLMLLEGLRRHYDIDPVHLRFLSVHYEADKEHSKSGHELIDHLVLGTGQEEDFLAEAGMLMRQFWKGFELPA